MLIEIRDGVSVDTESIQAVEKIDEYTCRVYTAVGNFDSTFPYSALLQIIYVKSGGKEDNSGITNQYWAG